MGLSSVAANDSGEAPAHFQIRGTTARFRLRKGHRAGLSACDGGEEKSGIYNLGSGVPRSFNDLLQILNHSLAKNFEPEYFDYPHAHYQDFTQADLTNSRKDLGYEPQFSFEDGGG
jgi:nucleoside-diphosphate-sugar epimerase